MKTKLTVLTMLLCLVGCSNNKTFTSSQTFDAIVESYSNLMQSVPNSISYRDITLEYKDSIENFLWSNAPFVNWEGILEAINTKDEVLFGRESTEVLCLIKTKIGRGVNGVFLMSFYKNDEPAVFDKLKECPIGSKIYFGFVPWQIRDADQLQSDILNSEFNLRGGLFYIGHSPQLYSTDAQRIVAVYDSLRNINPNDYIRIKDSVPTYFEKLSIEEKGFINEFSSFRNIYDEQYPRPKIK